jgi:hypothetical protein
MTEGNVLVSRARVRSRIGREKHATAFDLKKLMAKSCYG